MNVKQLTKAASYIVMISVTLLVFLGIQVIPKVYSQASYRQQDPFIAELEWSPIGTVLAVGTATGVHLLTPTFQEMAYIETPFAQGLAWSPNGEKLAIGYYDSAVSIDGRTTE